MAQKYTRGCACRCKHTCAQRCVPMMHREGQLLALTMSVGQRICQPKQPDCHKPPAARRPSQRRLLTAFFSPPLPSLVPLLPGALLSISLWGQGPLSCPSHFLCPSLFGQFLWGAYFVVLGPAGPQPCQARLFWVLRALFFFVTQSKSGLPAQPGDPPTPGAARNRLTGTQDSPGPQALD